MPRVMQNRPRATGMHREVLGGFLARYRPTPAPVNANPTAVRVRALRRPFQISSLSILVQILAAFLSALERLM